MLFLGDEPLSQDNLFGKAEFSPWVFIYVSYVVQVLMNY